VPKIFLNITISPYLVNQNKPLSSDLNKWMCNDQIEKKKLNDQKKQVEYSHICANQSLIVKKQDEYLLKLRIQSPML
jgi:hypothetical protein